MIMVDRETFQMYVVGEPMVLQVEVDRRITTAVSAMVRRLMQRCAEVDDALERGETIGLTMKGELVSTLRMDMDTRVISETPYLPDEAEPSVH